MSSMFQQVLNKSSCVASLSSKPKNEVELQENKKKEASTALWNRFCNALREEDMETARNVYTMTLEEWVEECNTSGSSSSAFGKGASWSNLPKNMEHVGPKLKLFFNNARASLKTLEDPNFRVWKENTPRSRLGSEGSDCKKQQQVDDDDPLQKSLNGAEPGLLKVKNLLEPISLLPKSFFFKDGTSTDGSKESSEPNNSDNTTPLHEICRCGSWELFHLIVLSSPTNLVWDAKNGKQRTLLHMAAGGHTKKEGPSTSPSGISREDNASNFISKKIKNQFQSLYTSFRKQQPSTADLENNDSADQTDRALKESLDTLQQSRQRIVSELIHLGISLTTVDERNRTALHYAAELGRQDICKLLIFASNSSDILLTIVDEEGLTAVELASRNQFDDLAATLEAFCIWKGDENELLLQQELAASSTAARSDSLDSTALTHPFSWFKTLSLENVQLERMNRLQAIQSCFHGKSMEDKPNQLSDTSIMKLLTHFEWDVDMLQDKLKHDDLSHIMKESSIYPSPPQNSSTPQDPNPTCLICCDDFSSTDPEWMDLQNCEHGFCHTCLSDYIQNQYDVGLIVPCPHHTCSTLLSQDEIQSIVPDTLSKITKTQNELFISSSHDLRFCPKPGCNGIVQKQTPSHLLSNFGRGCIDCIGAVCVPTLPTHSTTLTQTYEGAYDPNYKDTSSRQSPIPAHRFCFICGKDPHWPVLCFILEKWLVKISKEVHSVLEEDETLFADGGDKKKFEELAHELWIKANTRPCPKCKAPIEKNDGCNHMTCSNRYCRYEFCWICRKDWKLHNSKTGGFFRCNRWQEEGEEHDSYSNDPRSSSSSSVPTDVAEAEALRHPDRTYGTSVHSAKVAKIKSRNMARFLHYYERWTAHEESAALEKKMQDCVLIRLWPVLCAAKDYSKQGYFADKGNDISFIYAAFTELLECRSFLKHSYVFAFYRYPSISNTHYLHHHQKKLQSEKVSFEILQSELEIITEQMSDIVARQHLRASEKQIVFLTHAAADKRREVTNFMIPILSEQNEKRKKAEEAGEIKDDDDLLSDEDTSEYLRPSPAQNWALFLQQDGTPMLRRPDTGANAIATAVASALSSNDDILLHAPLRRRRRRRLRRPRDDNNTSDDIWGSIFNEESDDGDDDDDDDGSHLDEDELEEDEAEPEESIEETINSFDQSELDERQDLRRAIEESIRTHMASETEEADGGTNSNVVEWECHMCTYRNGGGRRCAMCGTLRR